MMAGYRLYDLNPVYFNLLATQPADGGFLYFYDIGTTTPRATYSDRALTIPNSNPVLLDSTGRANVNVWLDGAYTVVCKQSNGVTIWTEDVDNGATSGTAIPSLVSGQFLTNDGTNLLWQALKQVPDPTGSSGKYLSTDGTSLLWQAVTIPASQVSTTANSIKVIDKLVQWGSATFPASGARQIAGSITFGTPYDSAALVVLPIPTNIATIGQQIGAGAVLSKSATGATIQFDSDDFAQSNATFTSSFTFDWLAIGPKA